MSNVETALVGVEFDYVSRNKFYTIIPNISRTTSFRNPEGYDTISFYDNKGKISGLLLSGRTDNREWVKRYFLHISCYESGY